MHPFTAETAQGILVAEAENQNGTLRDGNN